MKQTHFADFGRVDQTADPTPFIRFLDAACAEGTFRAYKGRMAELLGLPGEVQVLDVGCGTGDDAREMARLATGAGRVVGLDNSQAMIAEAQKRAVGSGMPYFVVGDALDLPFEADSFDACRADRSLMHVPDAWRALAEMLRVTRPGGVVVVYEVDFETVVIDAADRDLARRVVRAWCDGVRDCWLGRRIPGLLRGLGLKDVTVVPHTLILTPPLALPLMGAATVERAVEGGSLSEAEGRAWLSHLDELQRTGTFLSTLTGFLVAGRK
jgi:SAM-dependent methyltransferase